MNIATMANLTCMPKSYRMTEINKVKIKVRQTNFSYKWYEVQRSYNTDLYVYKDRYMIDKTVIL